MYLINGQPLTKDSFPEHFEFYQSKLNDIKSQGKDNFIFKSYPKVPKVTDEHGNVRVARKKRIVPVECIPDTTDVAVVQWTFVKSLAACKKDVNGSFVPKKKNYLLNLTNNFSVKSASDLDLIFYFKYLNQNKEITEVDPRADIRKRAKAEAAKSEIRSLIFGDDSPISPSQTGTEKTLRNVAIAWGVQAESLDIDTVKFQLWDKVVAGEAKTNGDDGRGFEAFKKDVKGFGSSGMRTTIQMAIQMGVLEYKDSIWFLNERGGTERMICSVSKTKEESKEEILIQFSQQDEGLYEEIEQAVSTPRVPTKNENINSMERPNLMASCKELGWKDTNKMKNERLREIVKNQEVPEED